MSAFMCSDKHFWYLAVAFKQYCGQYLGRYLQREDLQAIAQTLKHENALSIASRYPRDAKPCPGCGLTVCCPTPLDHDLRSRFVVRAADAQPEPICPFAAVEMSDVKIDPVVTLKSIACYSYQSCEHDGWETSRAKELCDRLRDGAISALPGYEQAPWGID